MRDDSPEPTPYQRSLTALVAGVSSTGDCIDDGTDDRCAGDRDVNENLLSETFD